MAETIIPKISIITPSYNQSGFLTTTIESVISQEGNFYLDYIIVDGGSTDGSLEIIKKYEELLKQGAWPIKCYGITYRWIHEKDKGQADAVNKGLRLANGEIIGWLNSDDTYYPGVFEQVAQTINPEKGVCMVMGRCAYIDEADNPVKGEHPSSFVSHRRVVEIWRGYTIPQPAVFFHRTVFETCGGLDESLYYTLDYDLFLRYTRAFRIHTVDTLFATYRLHLSAKSSEISQAEFLEHSLDTSRRYWGARTTLSYWRYFFSFLFYGGKLGIYSLKMLNAAERSYLAGDFPAFLGNFFVSFVTFPPIIFRYIVLPRLKRLLGIGRI